MEHATPLPSVTSAPVEQTGAEAPQPRVKLCPGCNEVWPLGSFYATKKKVLKDGVWKYFRSYMKVCKTCTYQNKQKKEIRKRRERQSEILAHFERLATKPRIDVPHISEVGAALTKHLGGVDEACKAWAERIRLLEEVDPKAAVRAKEAWAKVIQWSTENRQTAPDVSNLTDEDLKRELVSALRETGEGLCGDN